MVTTLTSSIPVLLLLLLLTTTSNAIQIIEEVDAGPYATFVPINSTQTCMADVHLTPFNSQVRGVNLGSWFVLEPWITPSMFYQFMGKPEGKVGFDQYTFCDVLGPTEGNIQMRRHYATWVTKQDIAELSSMNVNSLRLPVGDWMYKPYGPYVGCTDGALDYVDLLLDWALEYNLTVLIDIHGVRGSQNGFDNSGQQMGFEWTSKFNTYPAGLTTFQHWTIRSAEWMGKFDRETVGYPKIDYDNIQHTLDVIQEIVDRYKDHPAVFGLEPVNEPWELTPIEELKNFYWEGYLIVKRSAPTWKFVMHDSFRFTTDIWGGFMDGCPDRVLDTHIYQAWNRPGTRASFYMDACAKKASIVAMEAAFGPVIVGEWSLATDNCAMWLNGFNDNVPGFPMLPCKYIQCAEPYMGDEQPGCPPDPGQPYQGPYGTGVSGPAWGQCPVGRDWIKEHSSDPDSGTAFMRAPPEAPLGKDATDEVMTKLARKKINTFSGFGHGFYFWNFKTDVYEPEWNYMAAVRRGWITTGSLEGQHITTSCHKEDSGEYRCIGRRGINAKTIRGGMAYAVSSEGKNASYIYDLEGDDLDHEADLVFNAYWKKHRLQGATCDFGGAATLIELNTTIDDDEFDDDWTDDIIVVEHGMSTVTAVILIILGSLLGAALGFITAMKTSVKFNRAVRKSAMFKRIGNSRIFVGHGALLGGENMPILEEAGGGLMGAKNMKTYKSAHL